MKLLYSLLFLSLVGCATPLPTPAVVYQCDKLAWYARAIATLRDIGIEQNEVNKYTSYPKQIMFSTEGMKDIVYQLKAKNPADIYVIFYSNCLNNTYQPIVISTDDK